MPDDDAIHVEPSDVAEAPAPAPAAPAIDLATMSVLELAEHIDATYDGDAAIARLARALLVLEPERERAIRRAERLRLADLFEGNAGLLNQYAETGPVELVAFLLRLDHE